MTCLSRMHADIKATQVGAAAHPKQNPTFPSPMTGSLLPKRFLFHFALPCRYRNPLWSAEGAGLDEGYRLSDLSELEGARPFADLRMAWSEAGLACTLLVHGKRQDPWCRETRPEDSDGLQLWIDTRDVHTVHRATRFCHSFLFLPGSFGVLRCSPLAQWVPIHRAREDPRPVRSEHLGVRAKPAPSGYQLDAFIPATCLTGFDPEEHPRLGFTYAVYDRELGVQTLSADPSLPFQEDPSLWATLELVR